MEGGRKISNRAQPSAGAVARKIVAFLAHSCRNISPIDVATANRPNTTGNPNTTIKAAGFAKSWVTQTVPHKAIPHT